MGKIRTILGCVLALAILTITGVGLVENVEAKSVQIVHTGDELVETINNVERGETIEVKIADDIEENKIRINKKINVVAGAVVVLNLNGKTLELLSHGDDYMIEVGISDVFSDEPTRGSLTIEANGGTITNDIVGENGNIKGLIKNSGYLMLNGGTYVDVENNNGAVVKNFDDVHEESGVVKLRKAKMLAAGNGSCIYTDRQAGGGSSGFRGWTEIHNSSCVAKGGKGLRLPGGTGVILDNVEVVAERNAVELLRISESANSITKILGGKYISENGVGISVLDIKMFDGQYYNLIVDTEIRAKKYALHVDGNKNFYRYSGFMLEQGIYMGGEGYEAVEFGLSGEEENMILLREGDLIAGGKYSNDVSAFIMPDKIVCKEDGYYEVRNIEECGGSCSAEGSSGNSGTGENNEEGGKDEGIGGEGGGSGGGDEGDSDGDDSIDTAGHIYNDFVNADENGLNGHTGFVDVDENELNSGIVNEALVSSDGAEGADEGDSSRRGSNGSDGGGWEFGC